MRDVAFLFGFAGAAAIFLACTSQKRGWLAVNAVSGAILFFVAGVAADYTPAGIITSFDAADSPLKPGMTYMTIGETLPMPHRGKSEYYALLQQAVSKDKTVIPAVFPEKPPVIFMVGSDRSIIPLTAD